MESKNQIVLILFMLFLISSCANNSSSSKDKCSDMNSYRGGQSAARENGSMLADCNYYWNDLGARYSYDSKSCFCRGFNDY